jgi:hypothetical protein
MRKSDQPPVFIGQTEDEEVIPALVAEAGGAEGFAWEELFQAEIRNPHTRWAYRHAVR